MEIMIVVNLLEANSVSGYMTPEVEYRGTEEKEHYGFLWSDW